MANRNLIKDGEKTQFSSTNQPANSGRRPSVFAKYIRENRVSLDDIRALISSLLTYDAAEIEAILKNEKDKPPIGIILLLKAIAADASKGELTNWEKLMDRVHGRPEKKLNHEIGVISPDILSVLNDAFNEEPEQKRKPRANGRKPGSTEN